MTCNKPLLIRFIFILFLVGTSPAFAQAPNISYTSPQTYTVNKTIASLVPTNVGGAVPPLVYGNVSTFAGSGVTGSADGKGNKASFSDPRGLAIDKSNNIYVADDGNHKIRKITPSGQVSTFAGSGIPGSANGVGTAASFDYPNGLTVDASGNIYVADQDNHQIRKITYQGVVSTIAGNGSPGVQDGPSAKASFNFPYDVALDSSGNIYVADYVNNEIRKISTAGTVSTFAGSINSGLQDGSGRAARFHNPSGLVIDASNNIYIVDYSNNSIRKANPSGLVTTFAGSGNPGSLVTQAGVVTTVAGYPAGGSNNGAGTAAGFNSPDGIAVDYSGNLYIADGFNNLIRKITSGGVVTILAGNGNRDSTDAVGTAAGFSAPTALVINVDGNLYITDDDNSVIRKISLSGYTIDKPLPPGLSFDQTTGIISGRPIATSPATDYVITAYNADGSSTTVVNVAVNNNAVVLPPPPNITYQTPQTYYVNTTIAPLAPANSGGAVPAKIYGQVTTFAGGGAPGNINGPAATATFDRPVGLVFDASGNLYVSETANNDIRKITPAGVVSTFAGNGQNGLTNGPGNLASFNSPAQLAIDASGNIYVADEGNGLIRKITPAGTVSNYAGIGGQGTANGTLTTASFDNPVGVTIDPSGIMYVADRGNSTIRKIDKTGQVTTFAVFNGGSAPAGNADGLYYLAIDVSGNLVFVNSNQVEAASPSGVITVVAGSGNPAYLDGISTLASFNTLIGIAVAPDGCSYVGDAGNNMVRSISLAALVKTIAGETGHGFDDGVGSSASFYNPNGVAVDPTGNFLLVADDYNDIIRKVTITGYTIDKSLPNGLTFDPTTGIISGTPSITSPPEIYTITAYNTGGSCTTQLNIQIDEQTIVFGPLPPKTVCDVDFDPGTKSSNPVTYASDNPAVATIVSGTIHITGAGTAAITASDGTSQITQTLTVTPAVTPSITLSPVTADGCQGDSLTFTAAISGGGIHPGYQWEVNGQTIGPNSPQFSTTNLNEGDRITCILNSNAACVLNNLVTSNTATFTLDPSVQTSVKITSDENGPVCAGSPVTFTAIAYSPNVNPNYQWQVNGINVGANQSTFTTYSLSNTDVVNCIATSSGKCIINPQAISNSIVTTVSQASLCVIVIPNTFTPNGDGINDLWDITALQRYPGCSVSIYSRGGSLVYNSINYPKGWDGNFNGQKLPVGTYYYVIDLRNGKKPLAGAVTILR